MYKVDFDYIYNRIEKRIELLNEYYNYTDYCEIKAMLLVLYYVIVDLCEDETKYWELVKKVTISHNLRG